MSDAAPPKIRLLALLAAWQHPDRWEGLRAMIQRWRDEQQSIADFRSLGMHGAAALQEKLLPSFQAPLEKNIAEVAEMYRLLDDHFPELLPLMGPPLRDTADAIDPAERGRAALAVRARLLTAPSGAGRGGPEGAHSPDPETHAIALLVKRPDLTIPKIAKAVGVSRQTLYGWPHFRMAAEKAGKLKPRGSRERAAPRGHKSKDGRVEAYSEERGPLDEE